MCILCKTTTCITTEKTKSEIKGEVESEIKIKIGGHFQDVFAYISQCVGKCRETLKPSSDCLIFKVRGS